MSQQKPPSISPTPTCFSLQAVSKTFNRGSTDAEVLALDSLTIDVPWNAKVALLGFSGSGKSTLLNLLGLLDQPDDGQQADVVYHGNPQAVSFTGRESPGVRPLQASARAAIRRTDFGFVFQFHHLLEHLTCTDNVALELALGGVARKDRLARVRDLLESLGMTSKANKKPRQLSGGEAQRVAVLRAIANEPRVVLADEPTGNLDAANAKLVLKLLNRWQQAGRPESPRTLLWATHNLSEAFDLCDHFLILKRGKLHAGRLLDRDEVRSASHLGELLVPDVESDVTQIKTPVEGALDDASTPDKSEAAETSSVAGIEHQQTPNDLETTESLPSTKAALTAQEATSRKRPTGKPSLRYLGRLAWLDLYDHLWSVVPIALTLLLLVVLGVVGWGLLEGKRALMSRELETPMARCLDVDCLNRHDVVIDEKLVDQLARLKQADGRPITDSPGENIFPWMTLRMLFWQGDRFKATKMMERRHAGRTVVPADPLLAYLDRDGNTGRLSFSANDAWEIIVTRGFLKECGYPATTSVVWLDCKQTQVPLSVRGVVEAIPAGYSFLLPDGFYQQLKQNDFEPDPYVDRVWLSPFPAARIPDAREALQDLVENANLELLADQGNLELRIGAGRRMPASRLRFLAIESRQRLEQAELIAEGSTSVRIPPPESANGDRWDNSWSHATIVARNMDELEPVAAAAATLRLSADRHYIQAVQRLHRTVGPLQTILVFMILVAGCVAVANLWLTTWQRVQQKRYEIGILKASGMTAGQLSMVFLYEGLILGCTVGLLGILAGYTLGSVVGKTILPDLFRLDLGMSAAVFLTVLVLCLISSWLATHWSARTSPAELLRR